MTEPTTNDQGPTTNTVLSPIQDRLLRLRLSNQFLDTPSSLQPAEIVASLVAVQAQDYPGGKWALGLRTATMTDAVVEQAFTSGAILRTHVLRPTWHFVAPADIRWLLSLTAPRVQAFNRSYHRKLEIDDRMLAKSRRTIERALAGEPNQTRSELSAALRRAGIDVNGVRLALVMMHAELEGAICSGPRRGKQFTYALLDVRAPRGRRLDREEALAELTRRYFASHGPATIRDYAWWSGLGIGEVRTGVEMIRSGLEQTTIEKLTYWFAASEGHEKLTPSASGRMTTDRRPTTKGRPTTNDRPTTEGRPTTNDRPNDQRPKTNDHHPTHLLPNYDEYLIAYQDRGLAVPPVDERAARPAAAREFPHHVIVDGRLAGSWRRRVRDGSTVVEVALTRTLHASETGALARSAARFSRFLETPVDLIYVR